MFHRLLVLLAPFALATLVPAAFAEPVVKTEHVEAQLVSGVTSAQPGKPIEVGLKLRMADEWHTYWKNPGDSGLPTRIHWELPAGWKASEIEWPYPRLIPVGPLMNYGYQDDVVLLTRLTPPADAPAGTALVKARVEWLVCKEICVPEKGELDLPLQVSPAPPREDPRFGAHIERARDMLPVELPGWKFASTISAKSLVLVLTAPAGSAMPTKVTFFPERGELIEPAAPPRITRDGQSMRIEMKLADPPPTGVTSVAGVAVAEAGWPGTDQRRALAVTAPVVTALSGAAAATVGNSPAGDESGAGTAIAALGFAFLGGLLLNLMPCVFPVLGIKVMGFVKHAHGEARVMRLQGLVFAGGVLLSFAVLAGIMLALRAGGAQLGWGFQLQSPVMVTLLACLFFLLALNLSGLFEWGAFAQAMTSEMSARGRYGDALLSGVLATLVATPCTAPFMGAAVGFTVTQSAGLAIAIFLMLGAGMALPVTALAFFPAALKRLPRPGAWMETFKQVLAFPLYATTAWLAWVLGAQAGNDAILALLLGLVLVAAGGWLYGRGTRAGVRWETGLALAIALAGIVVAWPTRAGGDAQIVSRGEAGWDAWSPEKVQELLAQGRPVFVDFTAAWCVTCQVNKRIALHDAGVAKMFAVRNVALLTADWTRQDARITQALAALGRNAVPVYALYVPGEDAPRLLPEVLTPSLVVSAVEKLPAALNATAISQR